MSLKESKVVREILEDLAENTQLNYKSTLRQFHKFVNSEEGLSGMRTGASKVSNYYWNLKPPLSD